jgi:hypothetical protein
MLSLESVLVVGDWSVGMYASPIWRCPYFGLVSALAVDSMEHATHCRMPVLQDLPNCSSMNVEHLLMDAFS